MQQIKTAIRPLERFSLTNQVAIVTGGLGLIGREHCRALADAGAKVAVCDVAREGAWDFARSLGEQARFVEVDVTSRDNILSAQKVIEAELGVPSILVNNAAINDMFENPLLAGELSRFENYPLEMWDRMWRVNVSGVFLMSQVFGNRMAENKRGSIINIGSTYGCTAPDQSLYRSQDNQQKFYKSPAYPVTKGAIVMFTRFLAAYWGHAGVRVNTLSPGGVENGQDTFFIEQYSKRTPLGRMAQANDYQGALLFLASDASAYVTGANLMVDGGWTAW